jgi:hypothetical protein
VCVCRYRDRKTGRIHRRRWWLAVDRNLQKLKKKGLTQIVGVGWRGSQQEQEQPRGETSARVSNRPPAAGSSSRPLTPHAPKCFTHHHLLLFWCQSIFASSAAPNLFTGHLTHFGDDCVTPLYPGKKFDRINQLVFTLKEINYSRNFTKEKKTQVNEIINSWGAGYNLNFLEATENGVHSARQSAPY